MKRLFCILVALMMSLLLCACGDIVINQYGVDSDNIVSKSVDTITSQQSAAQPAVLSASAPAATESSAPAAAPAEATVTASASVVKTSPVVITKSPYSESVAVGGSCVFIANAQNYTSVAWELLNGDGSIVYDLSAAPAIFGISVYGQGTGCVTLSSMTSAMNGWRIRAKFSGAAGDAYTDCAYIWTYYPSVSVTPVDYSEPYPGCPGPGPCGPGHFHGDPGPCPEIPAPCPDDLGPCPNDPNYIHDDPKPCCCNTSPCTCCQNPVGDVPAV